MGSVTFRAEVREQIEKVGDADIIVGIPSFNSARTIGHVVRAVQAGLAKYFPDSKAVIVNSDGGSSDGTMKVVQDTSIGDFAAILLHHRIQPISKLAFPYSGIPGKGSAFRAIFEVAQKLDAKACVVVDSDLRSITPEWIELLVKPVLIGGFDYVTPLFTSTSSTAPSPTASSIRSPVRCTASACGSPLAAISVFPARWRNTI
jgi:glycosyltransferase involved in cell wall biosynthesis